MTSLEGYRDPVSGSIAKEVFIHVDVDDLWAIAECYGLDILAPFRDHVIRDGVPRLARLFERFGLKATFFIVGRDLENPRAREVFRDLQAAGHRFANHSWSHALRFRDLSHEELEAEITRCHKALLAHLDVEAVGFRAPGYGFTKEVFPILRDLGYRYDSSLMPGPYGTVFRAMDARLCLKAGKMPPRKTQYPVLRDAFHGLAPFEVKEAGGSMLEFPVATMPFLRLPFQAGVCMRMGHSYFLRGLHGFQGTDYPFVFLFHGADLTDFSGVPLPFFKQVPYFATPVEQREAAAARMLEDIMAARRPVLTEEWVKR